MHIVAKISMFFALLVCFFLFRSFFPDGLRNDSGKNTVQLFPFGFGFDGVLLKAFLHIVIHYIAAAFGAILLKVKYAQFFSAFRAFVIHLYLSFFGFE